MTTLRTNMLDTIFLIIIEFYTKVKVILKCDIEINRDKFDGYNIYYMKHELALKFDEYTFIARIEKLGTIEFIISSGDEYNGFISNRYVIDELYDNSNDKIEALCLNNFTKTLNHLPKDSPLWISINDK